MIPQDKEEVLIVQCFTLSTKSGVGSVEVDYLVIKDFSKKHRKDSIELLQLVRSMASVLNERN